MVGKFIGKDSMGFKNGHMYHIRSEIKVACKNDEFIPCICIYDENSNAWCIYQDLEAVMNNWKIES